MDLTLNNSSRFSGQEGKENWWEWTAYIDAGQPQALNDIDFVEYHLHPSFKNPIRRVFDRGGGFPLKMEGWGAFKLRARVVYKPHCRQKNVTLAHTLRLERQRVASG